MTFLSLRDLKHALRRFAREPLFTVVILLTLSLGIGASTAVYSVVDGVLLEPLPYDEPGELVTVVHGAPGLDVERIPNARSSYLIYREQARSFESMALHSGASVNLTEVGDPVGLVARRVTPSLFHVLRVQPALGRPFTEEEGREGGGGVVILSHGLWEERFGGDPEIVGRTVVLNGVAHEVVGVMGSEFDFPYEEVRLWIPMTIDPAMTSFGGFNEEGIARLAPGVTPDVARREIQSLIPRLTERFPDITPALLEQTGLVAVVHPYMDDVVGDVRTALWVLLATVGFVLLIACANVANLMLVRAEGRRREVALRSAIGAGRGQLVGQHLTESLTLTVAGALLGLVLAWQGLGLLRRLGADTVPRLDQVGLDGSVLLVTMGVTALAAGAFALVPVLRHRSLQPGEELRDGNRSATGGRRGVRAREIPVAGQVALALVLLVGSGLMVRSFSALSNVDPGFRTEGVLTFRVSLPSSAYGSAEEIAGFHRNFLESIRGLPGVEEAGAVNRLPLGSMSGINGFFPAANPPGADEMSPVLETRGVTPGYFDALGRVLGAEIVQGVSAAQGSATATVVGIVDDVHNVSLVDEPMGTVYYALLQAEGET